MLPPLQLRRSLTVGGRIATDATWTANNLYIATSYVTVNAGSR